MPAAQLFEGAGLLMATADVTVHDTAVIGKIIFWDGDGGGHQLSFWFKLFAPWRLNPRCVAFGAALPVWVCCLLCTVGHNPQLYHSAGQDRNLRMKLGYGEGATYRPCWRLHRFDETEHSSSRSNDDSLSNCITVNPGWIPL